ncbi:DNA-processing protein DprA [Dongia rigui]|uniref:DNA-processing protein DprA n=1 Tax=Dongia rigui TaxID=940149 RepID=A0ABU5E0S4_9PROT|nr:DNA-processing protein DprA [Dongia rigui]MDY0873099.1 DNA-processing protein DprA [Dongia rigui]
MAVKRRAQRPPQSDRYLGPQDTETRSLAELLTYAGRSASSAKSEDLFKTPSDPDGAKNLAIHYAGDLSLLKRPCVAIVGTRKVSPAGAARARRLARELVERGVVVVSGLATGVDANAHSSALEAGGRTIAVIGTPLDKAYPAENAWLQQEIYNHHLLVSQFDVGSRVFPANFPRRNKVMAALSDATVIIEASDSSGTLHQAAECVRLGRWLFIARSAVEDPGLKWPKSFLDQPRTAVLDRVDDIVRAIGHEQTN